MRSRISLVRFAPFVLVALALAGSEGSPQDARPGAPAPGLADLAWMAGDWEGQAGESGPRVSEHWERPRAGRMLGLSHLHAEGRSIHREFAQISVGPKALVLEMRHGLDDEAPYFRYALRRHADGLFVFENPDYAGHRALRIAYRRGADGAMTVELTHRKDTGDQRTRFRLVRPATKKEGSAVKAPNDRSR